MDEFNATDHNLTNDHDQDDCDIPYSHTIIAYFISAFQITVCLYSMIGNSVLFYKQRNTLLWYDARPLFLNIFVANICASFFYLIDALIHVITISDQGLDEALEWYLWLIQIPGDASVVSIIFSISALTFFAFIDMRRLRRHASEYRSIRKSNVIVVLIGVWIWACVFALLGLGTHDERKAIDLPRTVTDIGHYGVVSLLQAAVALALYKIHKYNRKVQTDFAVHRAQQNLQFRTRLRRIGERTRISVPLLTANAAMWVVLLTMDTVIDQFTRDECTNENPLWEYVVDFISIVYCAIYPIILSRNSSASIGVALKSILCFRYRMADDVSIGDIAIKEINGRKNVHWDAIEKQWERVKNSSKSNSNLDRSRTSVFPERIENPHNIGRPTSTWTTARSSIHEIDI